MRIVQVIPRYAPAWAFGGGVRMFWLLATELEKRGHDIQVVTSDSLNDSQRIAVPQEQIHPRISVLRFRNPYNKLSVRLGPIFFRPVGMRAALRKTVQRGDIVHMGERAIHCLWAAQACARAGVPLVWSPYGGLASATGIRGLYRRLLRVVFRRLVVPHVSAFVAQTQHEAEACIRYGAASHQVRLIPLCVDWESFAQLPPAGSFRRLYAILPEARLVVCMARLHPAKGIDLLIRAFSRLQPTRSDPILAIVGWNEGARSSLQLLARSLNVDSRVLFCDPLYGGDRITSYVDANVFALTSRFFEETSLAALEAAACGTATIVTAQCEIPGLAGANGGRVTDLAVGAIATSLQELLEDDAAREEMGRRARQFVRTNLTAERAAELHENLFEGLLASDAERALSGQA